MKKSVYLLSLSTAFFASTTFYLLVERHRDADAATTAADANLAHTSRAHSAAPSVQDPGTGAPQQRDRGGPAVSAASQMDSGASASAADAASASNASGATTVAEDSSLVYARMLLARLDDPIQRTAQLDEARATARRQFARLKETLGLSDARFEQLVSTLAEQNVQMQENWARCAVTPGCDTKSGSGIKPPDDRTQELLALLGTDGMAAFTKYKDSIGERDSVAQFRGRLSDATFLPESQAEQLIAALADERQKYSDEANQSGVKVRGLGTNLGMIMYPDGIGAVEVQLAEAEQYSARLRARAATLLTPSQLAAYVQMQEELLAQLALFLQPAPRKSNSNKLALR